MVLDNKSMRLVMEARKLTMEMLTRLRAMKTNWTGLDWTERYDVDLDLITPGMTTSQ